MVAETVFQRSTREWIDERNWARSPYGPRLGDLVVSPADGGYLVADVTGPRPRPVTYPWPDPEHAARYVECVFNFGHPPR